MWRNALCLVAMALGLLSVTGAQPLSLKPLHVDTNLRASIAVSAQFQSLIVDETRHLTLPVWAADFSPDEQVDFEQIVSRSFSELELPEEAGWGLFAPMGNYLEIQVRVTDSQGRLGRVEFRRWDTWQLVSSIWANVHRTEASGVFCIPSELRELVAEVLSETGGVLARIAVDVGKFDTVVPVLFGGSFEPFCLEPQGCPHFSIRPEDTYGTVGDPYTPPGVKTSVAVSRGSYTTVYSDFTNDSSGTLEVYPPPAAWNLWRRRVIANTVQWDKFKVADPQSMERLEQAVRAAAQEDLSRAVLPVQAVPYSQGCARWRIGFTGQATAVLAIPYERKKRQRTLEAFIAGLATYVASQRGFLSALVATAANRWLQSAENQQVSGLKPGDVLAWGDVYSVIVDSGKDVPRWENLTQEWTVYVKARYSDGSTAPAEGIVQALTDTPLTNPPPPPFAVPDTRVDKENGAKIHLGKGWRWKLKVSSPGGEERLVDVPNPNPTVTLYINLATPPSQPPGGS